MIWEPAVSCERGRPAEQRRPVGRPRERARSGRRTSTTESAAHPEARCVPPGGGPCRGPLGALSLGYQVQRASGDPIDLVLPVTPKKSAAAYQIYVGFRLTPEQLAYNRHRAPQ